VRRSRPRVAAVLGGAARGGRGDRTGLRPLSGAKPAGDPRRRHVAAADRRPGLRDVEPGEDAFAAVPAARGTAGGREAGPAGRLRRTRGLRGRGSGGIGRPRTRARADAGVRRWSRTGAAGARGFDLAAARRRTARRALRLVELRVLAQGTHRTGQGRLEGGTHRAAAERHRRIHSASGGSPMNPNGRRLRLIGISGSLRRGSYNAALLRAAAEMLPDEVDMTIGSIRGIPLYDADVEADPGAPEAVTGLRDAIAQADGLLLVTPEYNNSIPGVFKNAIDWLSSPPKEADRAFLGKPV